MTWLETMSLDLQIFGFRALWSPYYFLFLLAIAIAYYLITGPMREKFGAEDQPTVRQQIGFYIGLILLYIVKGSPIDLLSHIMLTAHMTQMAIYLLVVPILIIKGIPVWIWKKVVYAPIIQPIFKLLTQPIVIVLVFNLAFSIYHMPAVFDFTKSSPIAHSSIAIALFILAICMWWVIYCPIKELDRLNPLLKIVYMVAHGALITPACALLIFTGTPQFAAYTSEGAWIQAMALCVPADVLNGISGTLSGPEMFSPLSTMDDQQLGAIIMQTVIQFVYAYVIGKVFFAWFKKGSGKIDPIPTSHISS